ncbi:polysaccharide pyruvyl transferase family protein [Mumia sp. zg.B53]|uniref:polysaccharide pyruvyl transferase family protein n=1 Tax=Mumia sp. zg.B53 TaxID=2855449 RepID=UPI001C6EC2F2|nr:polysaccharide pyruvyl transferase family protein [Mumia sp. zg.B53]MBW9214129.1 polysaccharide pyruvyl transferase family protein [Mumia sp. zg.B53]
MPTTPRRASRLTHPVRAVLGRRAGRGRPTQAIPLSTPKAAPEARHLATEAVEAYEAGLSGLAWERFDGVPPQVWARRAMTAYVRSGLVHDRERVLADLRALADDPGFELKPRAWYEALGPVYALGESDLARALFRRLDAEVSSRDVVGERTREARDWMRDWIESAPTSASAPAVGTGAVSFAVLTYAHPGRRRASANIGDHVQSLASLGHLVRHSGATFGGDKELAEALTELQERVPERLRVDGTAVQVKVIAAPRDASAYAEIPPGTWTLAFGWYMHALFDVRYGFPFHRNLLPLFVSFHCNKRDLMTPEAVDYLRQYGPIGCRDWTTVDLLLSMGVPAFFSGCLTTTVSAVFPDQDKRPGRRAPVAYVDVPAEDVPRNGTVYKHSRDTIRTTSFADNLRDAATLLDTYRSTHRSLVTSRLHAYLPARSLGLEVDFVPKNLSDPRFEGLAGIDDQEFDAIRTQITDLLEQMTTAILTGAGESDVYALWRTLTADRVREAEARRAALVPTADGGFATPSVVGGTVVGAETAHDEDRASAVDEIVVPVGADDAATTTSQVCDLLIGLAEHAQRPLRVTLLGTGVSGVDLETLRPLASPSLAIRTVETDGATVHDVLALGELLPDVDRAVLLPPGAVVHRDPGGLFDLDLGGHAFAAPTAVRRGRTSGFGMIEAAALRLMSDTRRSTELRRVAYGAHTFDFDAFEVDVLVLDLATMRTTGFAATTLERAGAYRLGLREALHLQAGPDRGVVPAEWAVDSRLRPVEGAALSYGR